MTLNFDELAEKLAKHGIHMAPEQPTAEPDDCYTCGGSGVEDADLALAVEYQRIEDLDAEIERLRELLPGPITREAIRRCMVLAAIGRGAWDEGTLVQAWLDRLDSIDAESEEP